MNNKTNNQNRSLLDQQRGSTGDMYQSFLKNTGSQYGQDLGNANDLFSQISGQYGQMSQDGGLGIKPNASGWFDLPGMGGGGAPDYGASESGYQNFADTGGINRGDFNPALSSYQNFMDTGGVGNVDAMRYRATSQIPAFYDKFKSALARRSNVQGGYAPGYDAQMKEIGRDSAREGFNASRAVEADIGDREQQGRMFGTSGFGSLMSNITGMEQSGKLAGLSGLKGISDSRGSFGQADAARNLSAQLQLMGMNQQGRAQGTQGLQGLYSSAPGAAGQSGGMALAGMGGLSASQLQNLLARSGIKNNSWMDLLGPGLGLAGSIFGGIGGGSKSS